MLADLGSYKSYCEGQNTNSMSLLQPICRETGSQGSEAPSWEGLEGISRRRELRVTDSAGSGSLVSSVEKKGQRSCWPHSIFSVLRQEFVTMAWKAWVPSSP